jgi:4-hydroxyphenylacetate 3-monooxygenase
MAIRTGAEYLEGLRDGREIWLGGERVADVTTHPLLTDMARSVAEYYDLHHHPDHREAMTYRTESGDTASLSFLAPRSLDDLCRRNDAMRRWAEVHCGFMRISPPIFRVLPGCRALSGCGSTASSGRAVAASLAAVQTNQLC